MNNSVSSSVSAPVSGSGRNTVIAIAKGIAIILMVIGHADAPGLLTNFIYTFHMPLFFMAAGYFFNYKYLDDPWKFISKRVKGLYFPFVKWSFVFLILHNVWFELGILNETYGNWTGGVTHPYTLRSALVRALMIVTGMNGYDEFMAGAFWFFRGLLISSIVFLLLCKLMHAKTSLRGNNAVIAICIGMVALTAIRIWFNLKITVIPNGGWREGWGIFFFGAGVLFRSYEKKIPAKWWIALPVFLFLCFSAKMHFCGMNNGGRMQDLITLPLTGIAGFIFVNYISGKIDKRDGKLRDLLIFIGENTLYVFIFHIISFKVVSLVKIWWYGLDFGQIGCHMVIHDYPNDLFWILYTIAGVGIPLCTLTLCRKAKSRISMPKLSIFNR